MMFWLAPLTLLWGIYSILKKSHILNLFYSLSTRKEENFLFSKNGGSGRLAGVGVEAGHQAVAGHGGGASRLMEAGWSLSSGEYHASCYACLPSPLKRCLAGKGRRRKGREVAGGKKRQGEACAMPSSLLCLYIYAHLLPHSHNSTMLLYSLTSIYMCSSLLKLSLEKIQRKRRQEEKQKYLSSHFLAESAGRQRRPGMACRHAPAAP